MELLNSANAMLAMANMIELSLGIMAGLFVVVLGFTHVVER
jgi:hypothetical protein